MTIVVTGATGQLGRLIVESLLAREVAAAEIIAVGRNATALAGLAERGVTTAQIDFNDPSSLAEALSGADTLMLVSGSEVGRRITQHTNAIDAAGAAGIGRIVYTSAPHADTSPLVLAPEHKATEAAILASGIPFTILRNGWYTENYVDVLEQARTTGTVVASVGDGQVASASRADYADAAAAVLTQHGHVGRSYELTGDLAWGFEELAATIASIVGRDVHYVSLSSQEHLRTLTEAGLDAAAAGFVVALDGNIRDGLLAETSGELRELIGRPTTPLAEGLRAAIG